MQLTFNADALHSAATAAGDVKPDGDLSYARIGKRAGVDIAVVSRVHRKINGPDLKTALFLARAYNLTVEDLVSIVSTPALAA